MKRLIGSFPVSVFLGLLFCAAGLWADPPTLTPTPTLSATVTPTPTPGPGSYSYTVYNPQNDAPYPTPFVVPGTTGNSMQISYTLATDFAPGGELIFSFPPDLCATVTPSIQPGTNTFYSSNSLIQPQLTYTTSGLTITVSTGTAITAGTTLDFLYGQDSEGGFAVSASTTQTTESFYVWANPQAPAQPGVAAYAGLVPTPAPILVWSATASPTVTPSPTITQTFTPSPSFTPSPTTTISATVTPSPTITPVGPVRAAIGFYTYPNPFDMRQQSCVTVRFPPTSEPVEITIFSLAGNPVCTVPAMAIQNFLGVAQWCGTDDYGRAVPGGLYFVRLKTPSQTWVHKMTVFH